MEDAFTGSAPTSVLPASNKRSVCTVALIGNPNTGKSTLFTDLVGVRQHVGNYPGVTVEKKTGGMRLAGRQFEMVDLPGIYSIAPRSRDEMVSVNVLLGRQPDVAPVDVALCIVDASNLERNLYLVSQVLELGLPTILAVNMLDIAEEHGILIDFARLAQQTGVPVIPVQAHRRIGIQQLQDALVRAAEAQPASSETVLPETFEEEAARLETALAAEATAQDGQRLPRYLLRRLLLDMNGYLQQAVFAPAALPKWREYLEEARARLMHAGCLVPGVETCSRYAWVSHVLEGVVTRPTCHARTITDRIDAVLTHRVWGLLVFAAVMLGVFQAVFVWAQPVMEGIEALMAALSDWVGTHLAAGTLRSLLVDGVLGGVGGILIFLPQILILFGFLAVLEDCGYMARTAYLMDRLMARIGLSGKSFIPMLSSFACAIPGIMATRVIEDDRDRLTTILVAPLLTCSARLPVYTMLIAAFIPPHRYWGGLLNLQGLTFAGLYVLGIVTAVAAAMVFKRTLLRGQTPPFVLELPSYKWPSPRTVVYRMCERGWLFVRCAGTLILAVSLLVWAALYFPHSPHMPVEQQQQNSYLGRMGHFIEPVVKPLGWDWRIGCSVLASFPAREIVVSTMSVMYNLGENPEGEDGHESAEWYAKLRSVKRNDTGQPVFNIPVALSIMVFFALCAQCAATLAVIRRETNSWRWPLFTFAYMTVLAYCGALLTYQLGMWISG